jgi:hypothetical protein
MRIWSESARDINVILIWLEWPSRISRRLLPPLYRVSSWKRRSHASPSALFVHLFVEVVK